MAPRSIWKGVISFGMVTIPVRLFNITSSNDLAFVTLHKTCRQRLRQKRWCPQHEVEVTADETARAYEYSKDQYVLVEDAELDALRVPSTHNIEIAQFVDLARVDPVYFDKSYVLEPEPVGLKPFYLLKGAMESAGLAALAKISIRQKETLCALRVFDRTIMLHTMYYADEVRGLGELNLPEETVQIGNQEKTMAKLLVEHLTGEFKLEGFKDGYREAALNLIEAKLNSTTPVDIPAAPAQGRVGDLMEALRASIEAAKKSTAGRSEETKEEPEAGRTGRRSRTPAAAEKTPVAAAEKKTRAKKTAVAARK